MFHKRKRPRHKRSPRQTPSPPASWQVAAESATFGHPHLHSRSLSGTIGRVASVPLTFTRDVNIDALNQLRVTRGWSIPDLSAHSGVSVSMLTKMLCGLRGCSESTATKVATALGCTPDDFSRHRQRRTGDAA